MQAELVTAMNYLESFLEDISGHDHVPIVFLINIISICNFIRI